jgi:hypothetical protein
MEDISDFASALGAVTSLHSMVVVLHGVVDQGIEAPLDVIIRCLTTGVPATLQCRTQASSLDNP